MHLSSVAAIIASVALSSGSQVLLKIGMTTKTIQKAIESGNISDIALTILTSSSVLVGFGCFCLSLLLWLFILARLPLSSAYPFVALGILFTVLARLNSFRRVNIASKNNWCRSDCKRCRSSRRRRMKTVVLCQMTTARRAESRSPFNKLSSVRFSYRLLSNNLGMV